MIDYCPTLFRINPVAIFICNQDADMKISQLYWQCIIWLHFAIDSERHIYFATRSYQVSAKPCEGRSRNQLALAAAA